MNARERFLATLKGEALDRPFRYEWGVWEKTIERWQEEGFPEGADFRQHFDMDRLEMVSIGPDIIISPFWPPFEEETIEEGEDWVVARGRNGIVSKALRDAPELSMPQFVRFPVQGRADWEEVKKRLEPDTHERIEDLKSRLAPHISSRRDYPLIVTMCGAYAHPRNLLGFENLSLFLYDDPLLIREIEENALELHRALFEAILSDAEPDAVYIWEDMAFKNGPLVSPSHFRELMLPFYKKLTSFLRSRGVPSIWVDSDGNISELIGLFLEGGVDFILPFEVQAGMDIVKVRGDYGEVLGIGGGIDKRALALDSKAIDAEIERVRPLLEAKRRYIPALDHSVPPNVPYENFCYYIEKVRSFE